MDVSEVIQLAGGVAKLADSVKVHHTSVIGWRNANRIPGGRVIDVERVTGIRREVLRPDLYPPSDAA
jgi:DNA-binding transcriptional regulator YdaS (Cro superfamily)